MSEAFEDYEAPCPDCEGTGRVPMNSDRVNRRGWSCDACSGHGIVLTERGEALVAFIHRRIVVTVSTGKNH